MPHTARHYALASLIVALLAALLFTPGLPGEFVFDDIPNIVNNRSIHLTELNPAALVEVLATPQVSGSLRGLPTLTFALDYWRGGGADPATFKTTNILIHALTTFALAWLFRSLLLIARLPPQNAGREVLGEPALLGLALVLALAWAAHPLQVSAVLYAVQRLQTMGTLFLVLALLAYLHGRRAQIEGRPGRTGLLGALLLWAVALGCKEDSVLLPAYTLALELTVLRFAAADTRLAGRWRRGYLLAVLAGVAAYAFWVLPHYWQWEAHAGRDFSTWARLLTQPRVLGMYLWQIVLPLPQHMPFYYDWVQPSRSLLEPWTTLPALGLIAALVALAWHLRQRRPLFALGIFLFFSAHFISSNVVALELAFEHRNHFALIGAVLALGSALAWASQRLRLPPIGQAIACVTLLAALCSATAMRAQDWRNAVSLAKAATEAAPTSPRAWIDLCVGYLAQGGGVENPNNPRLDDAIAACAAGADANSDSLNNLAVLIALKTRRGDIGAAYWERFQQRLGAAPMSWDNIRAPLVLTHYASLGVPIDKAQVLAAFATLEGRVELKPSTLAQMGDAVVNTLREPDLAFPYFAKAIEKIAPDDPAAWELAAQLHAEGWPDLAQKIEEFATARRPSAMSPQSAEP